MSSFHCHRFFRVGGMVCALLGLLACLSGQASQHGAANSLYAQSPSLTRMAPSWTLSDYRGREWKSTDYYASGNQSAKATVIVFLGTQCPLAKTYATRMESMAKEFEDRGVRFLGVNSNAQDSLRQMSVFARRHEISFPMVKDPDALIAEQFEATRTPEAFIIDAKGYIRYQGRIDDQYGIGYSKPTPSTYELKDALEAVLAGRPVSVERTEPVGCLIGKSRYAEQIATKTSRENEVTFCKDVAPILNRHCSSCHRDGQIGPMALHQFHDAAAWAEMICEVISDGRMPPWHADPNHGRFSNDRRLSEEEKATLHEWLRLGTPKGNEEDLPIAELLGVRELPGGWQLPREPDMVISMRETPYDVPATGIVDYQYFTVDPGLTEDKWIESYEIQPGNRSVVHHILVFAQDAKGKKKLHAERSYLAGYVPGTRVVPFPKGMAKKLEAGSRLIFQIHYTPVGTPLQDLSRIGLVFADPQEITHEVKTFSAVQSRLRIPPHESDYQVVATLEEPMPECQLLSMSPHMHVRGKSFMYEAIYPNGTTKTLLNVPKYDFGWQTAYAVAGRLMLPAGTKIRCTATFDNSDSNLNNPDSSKWVSWGDQTTDEMMIGYFDYAVKRS